MDKNMSETLVRTGPGTAMGNLMRRYWGSTPEPQKIPSFHIVNVNRFVA
jgi:hypothetical protein